ncbi:MAG TPA: transcription antitermination factor NusB [Bryobacteraceae bacterium]|nr:transcription antitermination factor NusB [Bryobacteraceae bacterium]
MSPARHVAFRILLRIPAGAHASDLLRRSDGLDARDAGLASEIVFGCLRMQAQLDALIARASGRPAERLDPEVRIALRIGIYQLRYLDRIPRHAAVAESVGLVRTARKSSAAGFVNAVLRKIDRGPVAWLDRVTALSHPAWLLESWTRQFGASTAERIALAFLKPPETWVRVPQGVSVEGVELEPCGPPGCYRVVSGEPSRLRIQDIGSQSIIPLLELESGATFLDLCAAPGNKTAQALEQGVQAVACDISPLRLAALKGLRCGRVVADVSEPLPFRRRFERILLDAPCSGTGTLGRNPEIKWRLQPSDLPRFHDRQVKMLTRALDALAPGGRLVYSTCSLEREENEAVLEKVLGRLPDKILRRLPGVDPGDGFFAAVIPSN